MNPAASPEALDLLHLFFSCVLKNLTFRARNPSFLLCIVLSGTELGSTGIWLSWPIGWCIGTVLSLVFYVTAIRKALAEPVAQAEAQGLEEEPVAQAEFAAQAEMETL